MHQTTILQKKTESNSVFSNKLIEQKSKNVSPFNFQTKINNNQSNDVPKTNGKSMNVKTKQFMESKFRHDFSNVRIHNDSKSHNTASDLKSEAFTVGHDIYFAKNKYNTKSRQGIGLLAHELTHVVQQSPTNNKIIQTKTRIESGNTYEKDANNAAIAVLTNQQVFVSRRVNNYPIQRSEEGGSWYSWIPGAQYAEDALAKGGELINDAVIYTKDTVADVAESGLNYLSDNIPVVADLRNTISKIGDVIDMVLADPIGFANNLFTGIKGGFEQFSDNILAHLKKGIIEWLFGDVKVALPTEFSLKAIFSFVMSVLGVDYKSIRDVIAKKVGEKYVTWAEKTVELVTTLVQKGPQGVVGYLQEEFENILTSAKEKARNWIVAELVKKAIAAIGKLAGFPVGAIIQAFESAYGVLKSIISNLEKYMAIFNSIAEAIGNIAKGDTKGVSNHVENTLANMITPAIGFIGGLIPINPPSKFINDTIDVIREKRDGIIIKIVNKLISGAKNTVNAVKDFLFPPQSFEVEGENHSIYGKEIGEKTVFMLESKPQTMTEFLTEKKSNEDSLSSRKKSSLSQAISIHTEIEMLANTNADQTNVTDQIIEKQLSLSKHLRTLMSRVTTDHINKYVFEGLFGTYKDTPKQTGDMLSPDHQPQHALIKRVSEKFPNTKIVDIAKSRTARGFSVNLHENRHKETLTFGSSTFTENDITGAMNKPTEKEQKDAMVNLMIAKRNQDANHVENKIIPSSSKGPIWADIAEFSENDEELETNVEQIRVQIKRGESQIRGTDNQIKELLEDK